MSTPTVPFKLLAMRAVTAAIKDVTKSASYGHDLNDYNPGDGSPVERVFRGRPWFGDSDPLPMVSVLEGTEPGAEVYEQQADSTTGEYDWTLLIQGFVKDDPKHPTDPAYYLMRDVRRRLAVEKRRTKPLPRRSPDPFGVSAWAPPGCSIEKITIGTGVVRPADDVSSKAYFWMTLTLRIVEDAEAA